MANNTKFKETEIGVIPESWSVVKLGRYFNVETGKNILKQDRLSSGTYPIMGANGCIGFTNDYLIDGRYILTGRVGTLGQLRLIDGKTWPSDNALIITNKKEGIVDFLYYYLKIFDFKNLNVGSSQPLITQTSFKNIQIVIPPLQEQIKIAEILSSLDDKIELNRKMNENLEKIGQALFKHWFADFEFPDENGKPYKSSGGKMIDSELGEIPEGWKVGFLGDNVLSEIIGSGVKQFADQKTYIATADVNNNGIMNYDTQIDWNTKPSRANAQPEVFTIWFAKMKNTNKKLIFTDLNIWEINNLILSTGFLGLKSEENAVFYLWNFINNNDFEMNKDLLCKGCTMEAINNDNVKNIDVILPSAIILDKFNIMYKSIYEQIYNNRKEVQNLSKIRDLLLPRLMNGKLRVE